MGRRRPRSPPALARRVSPAWGPYYWPLATGHWPLPSGSPPRAWGPCRGAIHRAHPCETPGSNGPPGGLIARVFRPPGHLPARETIAHLSEGGAMAFKEVFNGATAFRPWKLLHPRRRLIPSTSFNGATAFRPWKPGSARACRSWWGSCFNGATAFRPWKLAGVSGYLGLEVWLQWGHGLSAVETHLAQCPRHALNLASMGPRPFGRGN